MESYWWEFITYCGRLVYQGNDAVRNIEARADARGKGVHTATFGEAITSRFEKLSIKNVFLGNCLTLYPERIGTKGVERLYVVDLANE